MTYRTIRDMDKLTIQILDLDRELVTFHDMSKLKMNNVDKAVQWANKNHQRITTLLISILIQIY